ncbi:MAG: hypothetical protein IJC48_05710 [Clostridia bacterium]|nr:hypothetical protein [Clostridia bacterium]
MMLNSGDMPDAILGYSFDANKIVQYGVSEGILRPINDLLQYMPNFSKILEDDPAIAKGITAADGNIYGFPGLNNIWNYDVRQFIRTSWLDNLGLEMPKTLEEFKDVLIAVRDGDADGDGETDDEIPFTGSWDEAQNERGFFIRAYGYVANSGNYIAIDYNKEEKDIIYIPYAEYYKDFLLYMNDLWNEGLIDPDMFTQAETQVQATILEGDVFFSAMSAPYVYDPDRQTEWCAADALVDNDGDTPVWPAPNPVAQVSLFSINADASEEVAIAIAKLADTMYTVEWYSFAAYGPQVGSELDWNGDGHYWNEEIQNLSYNRPDDMASDWTHRCTNLSLWSVPGFHQTGYAPYRVILGQKYPETAVGKLFKDGDVCRDDEIQQQQAYSPFYVDSVPHMFFTADDLARVNELTVPLDDYVKSMEAKFIVGEISIEDEYDNFIATLEEYGVQELLEIYNMYY